MSGADTIPVAVEAIIERLLAGDLCTVELAPEAAAMLREVARERDEGAERYNALNTLMNGRSAALGEMQDRAIAAEAEADALREALRKMRGYAAHDDGCGVNALLMPRLPLTKQCTCGLSALIKETSDGL